jgi:hypothetical protein
VTEQGISLSRLALAITVFVIFGLLARFTSNYLLEGSITLSSVNAVIATLQSAVVFLLLYHRVRLLHAFWMGAMISIAGLMFFYLFLLIPKSFSMKFGDIYLFRDGIVTKDGILHYLPLAGWDAVISCLDLLVYSRLLLSRNGRGPCQ